MSQLTEIIIKSGIIPTNVLDEAKRWGFTPAGDIQMPGEFEPTMTAEQFCAKLDEAIQSSGYVLMRETDLGVVQTYLDSITRGVLHLKMETEEFSKFEVYFGRNAAGELIIPWRSDSITDLLTDGESFLKVDKEKIYFSNARELFYGTHKAFIVCMPSVKEPDAHRQ